MPEDPSIPPGSPIDVLRTDESGVDLAQIDYQLSLTPAQRLKQLEDFVNFVNETRRANRIPEWSATANSSAD